MNSQNIDKLVNLLTLVLEGHDHRIANPLYQNMYFDIFLDDIQNNNLPSHADSFVDRLVELLIGKKFDETKLGETVENFTIVWNAWFVCYEGLLANGYIKN